VTVTAPDEQKLVYDWAEEGPTRFTMPERAMLDDETLRDGLQSPSVRDPEIETKIKILHLMNDLGVETANVGLPGSGPRQYESTELLCREIDRAKLAIGANCAGRTLLVDIQPMADITQRTGVPIEACVFIGSSPIRQYAEEWEISDIQRHSREAIEFAVGEGLDVMYVTEDTVRSAPEHLRILLTTAVEAGAKRVCLCDTVGGAIPAGARNLVAWVKSVLEELGVADRVGIDWHGHRDRGLGLANTLAALEGGATRVHGTALGVGERVGNTPMEQILVNLKLLGIRDDDLSKLAEYTETVSRAVGVPIPRHQPIIGRDAFRTATGVHAAAVIKAKRKGQDWLADRVYSGVPAGWVGRVQEIEVGHMSGASNVIYYLGSRDLPTDAKVVEAVLEYAKKSERVLDHDEIMDVVHTVHPDA
jgi:2-isopropylmalate synthase